MALTRRDNPTFGSFAASSPLFGLQRLNRLLDEAFGAGGGSYQEGSGVITAAWIPPVDICEDANSLSITVELPGVKPEDVKLSLENNILMIHGEKRQEAEERTERVHRYERSYGTFERTFALPSTVDPEKIEANYQNGILTVRIPKAERARPREIRVNAGTSGPTQVSAGSASQRGGSTSAGGPSTGGGRGRGSESRDPEEEGSAGRRR
jgi:HSP20 family protein